MKTPGSAPYYSVALLICVGALSSSLAVDPVQSTNPLAELNDKGVTFPFCYIGEVIGNPSGGYRQGAIYDGVLQAGVQFDLEKLCGWKGATVLVNAIYPHGSSLTDDYVHDFSYVSNIDAYDSLRLGEAWFEQKLGGGIFSIRLGQMLVDCEFFVCDSSALFLNSAFGALPVVNNNVAAPIYPVAAPGVRIRFTPSSSFSAQFGAFAGDLGDPATNNRHGLFRFNGDAGALLMGEVSYTLNPPPEPPADRNAEQPVASDRPLSGTYKLGGYYFAEGSDDESQIANYAIYGVADQEVWHEPGDPGQGLRVFGHVGVSPDESSTVSFYFDAGLYYQGLLPSRDNDAAGVGVSYTRINDRLRDDSGLPFPSHHETIIEVTYSAAITEWLSLQPDFQYIFNPGATDMLPDALIAGLRFCITF